MVTKKKLKLIDIMNKASKGYPDACVQGGLTDYYDEKTGEPTDWHEGDPLAWVIVIYLAEAVKGEVFASLSDPYDRCQAMLAHLELTIKGVGDKLEDLPTPIINERSEKKMRQKPNNHKRRQILDFARDNNLVIHPGGGFEYYIKLFYKSGHCPCDKDRPDCPCPESVEEAKGKGHCKCCLFWRDLDTYKESHVKEY